MEDLNLMKALDIAWDKDFNLLISGKTKSQDSIASLSNDPFRQDSAKKGQSAFVLKLNQTGSERKWGIYYGDGSTGYGITSDSENNIYLTGSTEDGAWIAKNKIYHDGFRGPFIAGGKDGFFCQNK